MDNYKILKEGRNDKVLVEWKRPTRIEYSVHTWNYDKTELIWGHYFNSIDVAEEYFEYAQNR